MSFLIYYSCNTADRDLNPVVESIDIKSSLLNVPPGFGAGQMGNIALPGNTDTRAAFQEEALFENTVAHHLGDHPLQGSAFFNIKTPLGAIDQVDNSGTKTTIPPHLIPLGPDGTPLLNPDGTPILKPGRPSLSFGDNKQKLTDIFPFLSADQQHMHQIAAYANNDLASEVDNRDMLTKALNMVRELPMDTRRRMFAGLTMGVPMAALTMATMGLPTMAIAPMALAIPGFLFAAFTETDPNANNRAREGTEGAEVGGHHQAHGGHGDHGGHGHGGGHGGGHGHGAGGRNGHRRRGIAGLIDAVRNFRVNQNIALANNETNVSSASRQVPDPHDHGEAAEDGHRHHTFHFG